jgi:hypothetical protein
MTPVLSFPAILVYQYQQKGEEGEKCEKKIKGATYQYNESKSPYPASQAHVEISP